MNKLREVTVVKRITQFQLRLSTGAHQSKISMIGNGLMAPREDEKEKLAKPPWARSRRNLSRERG